MDLDIQSYSLSHLGIVAGIVDALKIGEVIDGVMLKQSGGTAPRRRKGAHGPSGTLVADFPELCSRKNRPPPA